MPLQMPHVSVCATHNELPQSKHCVLAVLEQRQPTASAEFLISTTSHRSGIKKGPSLHVAPKSPWYMFFGYLVARGYPDYSLP
jgi:hypothetical protein